MGRLKEFLSKAMRGETQVLGASGITVDTVMYESMGAEDAYAFLMDAFDYSFWHNCEFDEEDIPETSNDVLLAYRDETKKKGYSYRVGPFDAAASGWKEITFKAIVPKEIEFDDDFFDKKLESIRNEIPNVMEFSPIRTAYISGFFSASQKMKSRIKSYKWHDSANFSREEHMMEEEILAAVSENGGIRFEILSDIDLYVLHEAGKVSAWVNIEPFENILDQV